MPTPFPSEPLTKPLTITELDALMRTLERLPTTGDFRFDQAIGLAHDRLLMMWAEARRREDASLDAANVPQTPDEEHLAAHWRSTR